MRESICGVAVTVVWAYLLFWREVVHDIEQLADLFCRLALDHVRDGFTANVPVDRGISTRNITRYVDYK